jgi:hypothetical protein
VGELVNLVEEGRRGINGGDGLNGEDGALARRRPGEAGERIENKAPI